jgi:hypothetical protein
MRRLGAALVVAFALLGCSSHVDRTVLPWLTARTTTSWSFGIFSGAAPRLSLHVKRYGVFWHELGDVGVGRPVVLDSETVVFWASGSARLVRHGDAESSAACPGPSFRGAPISMTVPPSGGIYDCSTPIAGPAAAVVTAMRWRRLDPHGRVLQELTLDTEAPDVVFMRPSVAYYDATGIAYFVTVNRDWRASSGCTLLAAEPEGVRRVASRPGLTSAGCTDPAGWARVLGRALSRA